MALTHSNALKAAATDAVTALVAIKGGGDDNVHLDILTSGDVLLVTLDFDGTDSGGVNGFGAANGTTGIATAVTINNGTVVANGTAAKFVIYNDTNAHEIEGTVGTSGADINLNNVSLVIDQIVQITSLTYRALPA